MLSSVVVLGMAGVFGVKYLGEKNRQQTLEHIDQSIEENDLSQAYRTVRIAREGDPDNLDLQVQYARLLSRVQPRAALNVWKRAFEQTGDPEHGVGYTLACIQVNEFGRAAEAVKWLSTAPGATSAYHRAAYALSFAEGRDGEAFAYLEKVLEADPDSEELQFDWARLAARSTNPEKVEKGTSFLWERYENESPLVANEALRALALAYVERRDVDGAKRVLKLARDPERKLPASNFVWALEAEQRLRGYVEPAVVREAWQNILMRRDEGSWLNLLSWMNTHNHAASALAWATERPSTSVWNFPSGMLLADSAIRSERGESIVPMLLDAKWGDRDFLRLLILSRITEWGSSKRFWFDQAYAQANNQMSGGARLLLPVLQAWGWLDAETDVVVRLLSEMPL